ncbi:hypothetical protein [Streptomyces coeruleofuscus]|uniref:Uncharacterized protein n=1 Tax=Streptomyces coeruleofuscus TaxID=66879 RepID=A0ABN3I1I4_9ACTN
MRGQTPATWVGLWLTSRSWGELCGRRRALGPALRLGPVWGELCDRRRELGPACG